jgi:hypothetical protein
MLPQLGDEPVRYNHSCYVTDDFDRSMATFSAMGIIGEKIEASVVTFALCDVGPVALDRVASGDNTGADVLPTRIEVLMPTSPGTIFSDHLDRHGPGLHHLGVFVPDFDRYFDALIDSGCAVTLDLRGVFGDDSPMKVCFFDCAAIGFPAIEMFGRR